MSSSATWLRSSRAGTSPRWLFPARHATRSENESEKEKENEKDEGKTCEEDGLIASRCNGLEPLASELVEGCGLSLVDGFREAQLVVIVASPHEDGDWRTRSMFCEGQSESLLFPLFYARDAGDGCARGENDGRGAILALFLLRGVHCLVLFFLLLSPSSNTTKKKLKTSKTSFFCLSSSSPLISSLHHP